jgi:DNA-directed RNA polymerase specialized sigma24 family protein
VLADMGEGAREVVELRRHTALTIAGIAEKTGRPAGTVGSTLYRARARLVEALEGPEDPS